MASTKKKARRTRSRAATSTNDPTRTEQIVDEQAGDLQGLSGIEEADSESVAELVAEGQFVEAAIVNGIENSPDADVAEVTTKESSEDDVPSEYRNDK